MKLHTTFHEVSRRAGENSAGDLAVQLFSPSSLVTAFCLHSFLRLQLRAPFPKAQCFLSAWFLLSTAESVALTLVLPNGLPGARIFGGMMRAFRAMRKVWIADRRKHLETYRTGTTSEFLLRGAPALRIGVEDPRRENG